MMENIIASVIGGYVIIAINKLLKTIRSFINKKNDRPKPDKLDGHSS